MLNKLYLNSFTSILYQIISIVSGLIIPRLILIQYGSNINGIVSSITQLLGFITVLELGIGSVVQTSFYRPLLEKNYKEINKIYSAANNYFRNISRILIIYILFLILYYSFIKKTGYDIIFISTLVISIAISSIFQYYFGICNTLLVSADQKSYVVSIINIFTLILNTMIVIILIKQDQNIQFVKLVSSLIFLLRPFLLYRYIQKNYNIKIYREVPISYLNNKWSGMIQHLATVFTNSSSSLILTLFSSFVNISIFNIYTLPLNSVKALIESLCIGYKSFFGMLYVKSNIKNLKYEFMKYELYTHWLATIIFNIVANVLVPFVLLYTHGVNDINYENYIFGYLITLGFFIYSIRVIYTTIIFSAGHFKETQLYCLIECFLNIFLSILGLYLFGLIGIALGMIISISYRVLASVWYLKDNIINYSFIDFIKYMILNIFCTLFLFCIISKIDISSASIYEWFLNSLLVGIISVVIVSIVYFFSLPLFKSILISKINRILFLLKNFISKL